MKSIDESLNLCWAWMQLAPSQRTAIKQALLEATKELQEDRERLGLMLGIEKGEPNAGDDPSKEYWVGLDQKCYESLDAAIDSAIRGEK